MSTATKLRSTVRRGKGKTRRFPSGTSTKRASKPDFLKSPLFGMWKDYPGTVEDYMRKVRKRRITNVFGHGAL